MHWCTFKVNKGKVLDAELQIFYSQVYESLYRIVFKNLIVAYRYIIIYYKNLDLLILMGNLDHKPWHLFEFLQIKKKFILPSDSNVFLQRRIIFFLCNCKI